MDGLNSLSSSRESFTSLCPPTQLVLSHSTRPWQFRLTSHFDLRTSLLWSESQHRSNNKSMKKGRCWGGLSKFYTPLMFPSQLHSVMCWSPSLHCCKQKPCCCYLRKCSGAVHKNDNFHMNPNDENTHAHRSNHDSHFCLQKEHQTHTTDQQGLGGIWTQQSRKRTGWTEWGQGQKQQVGGLWVAARRLPSMTQLQL